MHDIDDISNRRREHIANDLLDSWGLDWLERAFSGENVSEEMAQRFRERLEEEVHRTWPRHATEAELRNAPSILTEVEDPEPWDGLS